MYRKLFTNLAFRFHKVIHQKFKSTKRQSWKWIRNNDNHSYVVRVLGNLAYDSGPAPISSCKQNVMIKLPAKLQFWHAIKKFNRFRHISSTWTVIWHNGVYYFDIQINNIIICATLSCVILWCTQWKYFLYL